MAVFISQNTVLGNPQALDFTTTHLEKSLRLVDGTRSNDKLTASAISYTGSEWIAPSSFGWSKMFFQMPYHISYTVGKTVGGLMLAAYFHNR